MDFRRRVLRCVRPKAAHSPKARHGKPLVKTNLQKPVGGRSNLHIYQSYMQYESRISKITKSLVDRGIFRDVVVIGKWREGLPIDEAIDAHRRIRRVLTVFPSEATSTVVKILQTLEWMGRAILEARRQQPECINCHSLLVLPVGVLMKWATGCQLVYDTHELETETYLSKGLRRGVAKLAERLLIRRADKVFVVGDAIADWYRQTYPGLKVHVVRNVPYAQHGTRRSARPFHERFGIPSDEMVFLYQGLIDEGRGIDLLLEAFAGLPRSKHVVFLGYGPLTQKVEQFAAAHTNIHYHPAVRPEQISDYSCGADVGLSIIENLSLSYSYCAPNKLFEYFNAGVPAIVSDLPEMSRVIDTHRCGWKVTPSRDAISRLIGGLTLDDVVAKRSAALSCRQDFCWEREEDRLLEAYGITHPLTRCA